MATGIEARAVEDSGATFAWEAEERGARNEKNHLSQVFSVVKFRKTRSKTLRTTHRENARGF